MTRIGEGELAGEGGDRLTYETSLLLQLSQAGPRRARPPSFIRSKASKSAQSTTHVQLYSSGVGEIASRGYTGRQGGGRKPLHCSLLQGDNHGRVPAFYGVLRVHATGGRRLEAGGWRQKAEGKSARGGAKELTAVGLPLSDS